VGVNAADSRGSFAPALIEHVTDRDLRSGLGHQFGRRCTDPLAAPETKATLPSSRFIPFPPVPCTSSFIG
jgi:hypothetical protein